MNPLPEAFLESIAQLFKDAGISDSFEAFVASYNEDSQRALRINGIKADDPNELQAFIEAIWADEAEQTDEADKAGLDSRVPWSSDGFYIDKQNEVGRSLAHRLGLYYIQEPSAMLPAESLGAQVGERIIDLCAAPGGKSAKIAADLHGEGLLVSNDISSSRGRILVRNLEQLGVANAVVTAADPVDLAKRWPGYFDRVLVDAPCSGEGMFRRDPKAVRSWSDYGPNSIIPIQKNILDAAYSLLKPGGELVYSTCTFNRDENEAQIEAFLDRHPDMELIDLHEIFGSDSKLNPGIRDEASPHDLSRAVRIWPHLNRGEGHFCSRLRKRATDEETNPKKNPYAPKDRRIKGDDRVLITAFYRDLLSEDAQAKLEAAFENRLSLDHGRYHLVPDLNLNFKGIHILKEGVYLANLKEGRKGNHIEPSHSAAVCMRLADVKPERRLCLNKEDRRVRQIVKGETIALTADEYEVLSSSLKGPGRGYLLVFVDQYPLTWLKLDPGGTLKNLYPAGWR